MKTLADAWNWYEATKRNLARMRRLGSNHWGHPSLEAASIWQDDQFRMLEVSEIEEETAASLKPIDDLAVVVLFSVFESHVRDYLVERIKPQAAWFTDPILKEATDDAIQGVKEGSFYRRVLEPLKTQGGVPADFVTSVDQVRDYRNWVAHGRREAPTNNVTPRMAYDRLNAFLAELGIAAEAEEQQSERPDKEPQ
ncbi:MAG TPA: hypothetical protein VG013_33735 [Gemmataceae bacterium]|jgi:hypothetical protein|nr:hypothetical protein [Gemmataceae bacterium]